MNSRHHDVATEGDLSTMFKLTLRGLTNRQRGHGHGVGGTLQRVFVSLMFFWLLIGHPCSRPITLKVKASTTGSLNRWRAQWMFNPPFIFLPRASVEVFVPSAKDLSRLPRISGYMETATEVHWQKTLQWCSMSVSRPSCSRGVLIMPSKTQLTITSISTRFSWFDLYHFVHQWQVCKSRLQRRFDCVSQSWGPFWRV